MRGKNGFQTTGQGFGRGQNPRGKDGKTMKCHKCGAVEHLKKECPYAKGSGKGSDANASTPSFATGCDGMTWAGITQDTPAQPIDCEQTHDGENEVFVSNAESSSSPTWCSSYSGRKHKKKARIEGDQETETVGILRSRSGSEETEADQAVGRFNSQLSHTTHKKLSV